MIIYSDVFWFQFKSLRRSVQYQELTFLKNNHNVPLELLRLCFILLLCVVVAERSDSSLHVNCKKRHDEK
jgi:hypothetical protein